MGTNADVESCCECGKEALSTNRPACVTCGDSGRRSVFCRYGSDCLKAHGSSTHRDKKAFRVATENISVPGSQSGHDVLGGLVPIETERSVLAPPPASSKAPSAADQFATLAFELAERIEGVAMRINQGSLPLDGAITAIEVLFAKFPADVHRLAEAVKNDAIRS